MSDSVGLYLVDSSIWIHVFRRSADSGLRERLDSLLAAAAVATTGVIRLELLRGTRTDQAFDQLSFMLDGLHQLPTTEVSWRDAARLDGRLRTNGVAVPSTDLLIATIAMEAAATLLHRDADFDRIAQHAPLRVERYVTSPPPPGVG